MRKKIKIQISAIVVVLVLASCSALNKLTQFHVDYNATFPVPGTLPIGLVNITTPDVNTNSTQVFSNNNTNADLLQSVKLDQLIVTVKSPPGQNLDFVKSVELYLQADGLPEVLLATKYDIPDGLTSLTLDLQNVELKEYLKKDKFRIRSNLTTDKLIGGNVELNGYCRFFVDAKIFGI
ncbi:MAG: hypothetical protein U0T73_03010 [Chitinophagales bacterium]